MIILGHRGAGGYEPGNTIRSFTKALEFDLDYIEMDVAVCRSGEVVTFHDAKVDKATNGTGFIADKTLAELKKLDGGKGEKIPTLEEALGLIGRKKKVNIEIKGAGGAKPVFDILTRCIQEKSWNCDDFLISSFNHHELLAFHALNSDVPLGAILAGIPLDYARCAVRVHAYSLHLSKEFITQAFVNDAHDKGLKVFAYTINDTEFLDTVRALGVDGIFTDYPDTINAR